LPGDNKVLVEAQPRRFYFPAYLASRGWVALRLDLGKIDWVEVRWPSGLIERFSSLSVDQIDALKEGSGAPVEAEPKQAQ